MSATEKWSERQGATQEMTPSGKLVWRAQIVFQVTDAPTEVDAIAQCPFEMNTEHDVYGSELRVNSIDPQKSGPAGYWTVRFGFSSDAPGTGGGVNTKARIRWSRSIVTEQVDRDYDGHPITNSVGDPPTTTQTRDFYDLVLTYLRWEPAFDLRKSIRYVGAICSDNFEISFGTGAFNGSVGGTFGLSTDSGLGVFKGEALCAAMEPAGDYEEGQSLVQVAYEFRFRARLLIKGDSASPTGVDDPHGANGGDGSLWASGYDYRFLDQGSRGVYMDGDTERLGEFYLRADEPATEMVRLNGKGKPLRDSIKLTRSMKDAFEFPALPAGASLDDRYLSEDPAAAFLIYKRHARLPFKGLIPLFK